MVASIAVNTRNNEEFALDQRWYSFVSLHCRKANKMKWKYWSSWKKVSVLHIAHSSCAREKWCCAFSVFRLVVSRRMFVLQIQNGTNNEPSNMVSTYKWTFCFSYFLPVSSIELHKSYWTLSTPLCACITFILCILYTCTNGINKVMNSVRVFVFLL